MEPARPSRATAPSLPSAAELAELTPRAIAAAKGAATRAAASVATTAPATAAGLVLCVLTQPVFALSVFSFIPAMAPHMEDYFGWGPTANSLLFLAFALLLFLVAVGNMLLMRRGVPPRLIIMGSLTLLLAHLFLVLAFPAMLLSVGPFLAWLAMGALGYSLVLGSTNAHLLALLGPGSNRVGFFQARAEGVRLAERRDRSGVPHRQQGAR